MREMRNLRIVFGRSMWDGALTGWQDIKTVDVVVLVDEYDDNEWHVLGGEWLKSPAPSVPFGIIDEEDDEEGEDLYV